MNHIKDIAQKADSLIRNIEVVKKRLVHKYNVDYYGQDARMVALDAIGQNLWAVSRWIYAYNHVANNNMLNVKQLNEERFLNSLGSGMSAEETEVLMIKFLRESLVINIHFAIDNLFTNILKDWERTSEDIEATFSFTKNKEIVIKETLDESDSTKASDALLVLTNARNSYHNNSIHRLKTSNHIVQGKEYFFKEDSQVDLSWEDLMQIIEENIKVLEKILLSDQVNWNDKVVDDFSSQFES